MSMAEFLGWEERQEVKYEFDGFEPVAMVGVSLAHSAVQRNILITLGNRLRGKPCQPHGSDLKIEVAGRIRYRDAFVVCSRGTGTDRIVTDPVVTFEILSDGSDRRDRITKNEEYRLTQSVWGYVMLEQDEPAATVFTLEGDRWVGTPLKGDAVLSMPEIDIDIDVPLAEFYEGLDFAAGEQPAA
jgi:Uma2 family endonuclease